MSSITTEGVKDLLQSAVDTGALSPNSVKALAGVVDIGNRIQGAMGVDVGTVQATSVVQVAMLIDDSGSIRFSGNTQLIRDGHNLVLDSLTATKQKDSILVHTTYLNGDDLYPFVQVDNATRMDASNYDPCQGTPLFDSTMAFLGTQVAKAQEFADNGVAVRTISLILTDGMDIHSTTFDEGDCNHLIKDMLAQENHIVAFMGVQESASSSIDFTSVAQSMGIPDEWILTPGNTDSEIRKAFNLFSQSAVQASQAATSAGFSSLAAGGFGN